VGPNAGRDITTFAGNYPGTNAAQFLYVANPNCPNGIFPLDTLVFDAPVADPTPRLAIGFSWTAIQLGGTTNLIFGVSEPSTTATATGVAFSDVLPEGVVVATPNSVTGSCGGGTITAVAGSNSVSLSGARLAPSSTCIFSVAVVGNTVGIKTNTTSAVSSIESGAGGSAKATLYVAPPPTITMSFADPVVYYMVGTSNTTTLTFTLGNPVGNPLLMTSFAFTDTLPPGLFVSTPSVVTGNCEGNVTAVAGSNIISFFGGVSQPSCTISVKVTSRAVGPLTNTTSTITAVPFVPLVNYAAPFAGTPATATVFSSGMYSFWQ
jgi:uncharacterized repeat protein (TIGR01451 family)